MQIGHEKSLSTLIPALAGANIIYGMGMMELGVTFSFIQLMIDDIIVDNIKNIIKADDGLHKLSDSGWLDYLPGKGFPAALQSPRRVGGQARLRGAAEYGNGYSNGYSNGYGNGYASGYGSKRPDIVELARQKAMAIMQYHKPEPLPSSVRQRIRDIIQEAEEWAAGR